MVIGFYVFDYFYLNLNPLIRYCSGVSILIAIVVAAIFFKARRDETSRIGVAGKLGKVVSSVDQTLSFERGGVLYNWEAIYGGHKVSFQLSRSEEKFFIQNKSAPSAAPKSVLDQIVSSQDQSWTETVTDNQLIKIRQLPDDVKAYSRRGEFLWLLIRNERFAAELNKYVFDNFKLAFDEGSFEFEWETGSNEETPHFRQICQSAIIFSEEISRMIAGEARG